MIAPQTPLPSVTRGNVSIDGNSQYFLGGNSNLFGPEIVLSGSAIASPADGLQLDSDGNRVLGLVIQDFAGNGVSITGDGNEIYGNYIGTTATGFESRGKRRFRRPAGECERQSDRRCRLHPHTDAGFCGSERDLGKCRDRRDDNRG